MESAAGWIAPIATMIAAMITAANLGSRATGWGFVVFAVGSISWTIVGVSTGQGNLLWTNVFLTIVNGVGIWRWLIRQARYDDGGKAAEEKSAGARAPNLMSLASIAGKNLMGSDGSAIGVVVDGMVRCSDAGVAYWVISEGGTAGIGERLFGLSASELRMSEGRLTCTLTREDLCQREQLPASDWPAQLERNAVRSEH
jgi:hypothetical protein